MEQGLQPRVLTVTNYGRDDDNKLLKTRITIQPAAVEFVIASQDAWLLENQEIHKVNVCLASGNNLEIYINPLDLTMLEMSVGTYFTAS